MAKKLSAIVLAAALSLSLLTGCGSGSTDTAASAPAETKGTEGSAAAAAQLYANGGASHCIPEIHTQQGDVRGSAVGGAGKLQLCVQPSRL